MKKYKTDFTKAKGISITINMTRELTGADKEIYITLLEYAEKNNNCVRVSVKDLSDEVMYSVKTVGRGIKKLADLKLIDVIKTSGSANEYRVLDIADSLLKRKILTEEDYLKYLRVKIDEN